MRSHRLASTTLVVLATALTAAGCGSGRDSGKYLPDAPAVTPNVQGSSVIPQVVVAGPKQEVLEERDAAKAQAAQSLEVADKAEKKRKAAHRELRTEREKAEHARKRAAARESKLRKELAAARKHRRQAAAQGTTPAAVTPTVPAEDDAPITASDTGSDLVTARNKRSDAEARAAVVRFHELLNAHDPASCDLLTGKLLTQVYGTEDALGRCRSAAEAIDAPVSVAIAESRAYGKVASIAVVTTIGDHEFPQTLRLILTDGTWRLDAVESRPAS